MCLSAENICSLVNKSYKLGHIFSFKERKAQQNNLLWVFMYSIWFLLFFSYKTAELGEVTGFVSLTFRGPWRE